MADPHDLSPAQAPSPPFDRHGEQLEVVVLTGRRLRAGAGVTRSDVSRRLQRPHDVAPLARAGCLPAPRSSRSLDYTQHRADWELAGNLKPWVDLLPGPAIHPDLSPFAALSAPDEDGIAGRVQIALLEGECLADPEACRQSSTTSARSRSPWASSPTVRMTATISSTVGGSAEYCSPVLRGDRPR
jgi:hypothetical protein